MRWLVPALRRACGREGAASASPGPAAASQALGGPGGSDGWLLGALALLDAAGGTFEGAALAAALAGDVLRLHAGAAQAAGAGRVPS